MEGVSQDGFRVHHLRQRIAQITLQHEDALADFAVERQMLTQLRDQLQGEVQSLSAQLAEAKGELERLKEPCEEEPCFPVETEERVGEFPVLVQDD